MAESVSFKAYLKRDGHEVEVRRFGVDGGAATSYMYLRSKIQAMFPSIQNDQFQVFWQDTEQDYIRVDSDEELLVALTSSNQQPLKVYVQVQNNSQGGAAGTSASAGSHQTHPGVVCDGCEGAVVGFRYKCVTCSDYDLCSNCESNSLHAEHFMLRMPTPMDNFLRHPKFIRKLFSHPHKFHKRHGWSRVPPMSRGCGDSQMGAGRCPFSRRGGDAPAGPAAAFAGVTDMFDFSALMDFIESLGVAGGSDRANQSAGGVADGAERANQSAAPSDASQNPNQGPSGSQTQESSRSQSERRESSQSERRESSPAAEYLNNIGQMVAAILDPLGVDVTFDVRSKTSQQAAGAASSDSSSAPTPAPAQVSNSLYPNILVPIPPTPAPAATPIPVPAPEIPSASSQTEPTPATTIETQTEPARERRNSDDWTLLNRESPTRGEASAMEVDETRGAKPKTPPPSAAQDAPSPSAPPHNDDMSDAERQRIQDAIETFRSMGFNFNTNMLRDQLKRQNFDFLSVLEMMLNAERK